MLRQIGHVIALAAFLVLALAATSASAITLDMNYPGATDPWQMLPLPDGTAVTLDRAPDQTLVQGEAIVLADGSWWGLTYDPGGGIAHRPSASSDSWTVIPLPSGGSPTHWAQTADGQLWFTIAWVPTDTSPHPDLIGRVDPATDEVQEFGGLTPGATAQAITRGPDGNAWFMEFGAHSVGRITANGAVTEFPVPASTILVRSKGSEMTVGPGGDLYFIVKGGVARMHRDGTFAGVINGPAGFAPNALAYGRDGNLWATECDPSTVTRISPSGVVTRMADGSLPASGCAQGIVSGFDGTPWFFEWNTGRAGRILFDTPLATTDDPTSITQTAADLNGIATPRGVATTVHFEYGTTSNYGSATPAQNIGDGDGTIDVSARPTDLRPATTYHYRLVASSIIGTVYGEDQTVTTRAVPPPPPPPLPADDDHDGFPVTVDCDDLSAAIHPGATDHPADSIDQDCSGTDAALLRFQPHADADWRIRHHRVIFTRMVVDTLPAGSSLKLTCQGPGCRAAKPYVTNITTAVQRLNVVKHLRRAALRKGARVELWLSHPGYLTRVLRWTMSPTPRLRELCVPPNARTPEQC